MVALSQIILALLAAAAALGDEACTEPEAKVPKGASLLQTEVDKTRETKPLEPEKGPVIKEQHGATAKVDQAHSKGEHQVQNSAAGPHRSPGHTPYADFIHRLQSHGKALLSRLGVPEGATAYQMGALAITGSLTTTVLITLAAAAYYRKYVKPPVAEPGLAKRELNEFSSGLFDCFDDMNICCWACVCPAIRWASTMDMVSFLGFWVALAVFVGIEALAWIPITRSVAGLIMIALLTYYRTKLRAAFGMKGANEACTVCGDCVFVSFCTCCAIAQEARHVKLAAMVNHQLISSSSETLSAPQQDTI